MVCEGEEMTTNYTDRLKELERQIDLNTNIILTHARTEHTNIFCEKCKELSKINIIPRAELKGLKEGHAFGLQDAKVEFKEKIEELKEVCLMNYKNNKGY